MDLHSKMTMYVTSTMTSPVTKTAKTSKWLRLKVHFISPVKHTRRFSAKLFKCVCKTDINPEALNNHLIFDG